MHHDVPCSSPPSSMHHDGCPRLMGAAAEHRAQHLRPKAHQQQNPLAADACAVGMPQAMRTAGPFEQGASGKGCTQERAPSCEHALLPVERLEGGLADALRQAAGEGCQHAQRPSLHGATNPAPQATCPGGHLTALVLSVTMLS